MDKRKNLCNLLAYAEDILRTGERVIADLEKDAVAVFHERDITRLEGVVAGASDDAWLRVERLRETSPPPLDPMFEGWTSALGAISGPPRLVEHLMVSVPLETASDLLEARLALDDDVMPQRGQNADPLLVDVILRTANMAEFTEAFRTWCAGPWSNWAEAERPRRQSIAVYRRLFEAYQRLVATGDDAPIECIFGVGVARWEHPAGRIDIPLIESMVELDFDETDGSMVVRPRQQPPRLSLRAFEERGVEGVGRLQREAGERLRRIAEDEDLAPFSPFNHAAIEQVLQPCGALAAGCIYEAGRHEDPTNQLLPKPDAQLRVTGTWVLYLRQRSVDFRCDDIRRLQQLIENTSSEAELPPPGMQLASKPTDAKIEGSHIDLNDDGPLGIPDGPLLSGAPGARGDGSHVGGGGGLEPSDSHGLFLPLPFNDEQKDIIRKLELPSTNGVVVQGPPGTGKTHTIANIICHYMARGRRVLVSARTPEALTAIQAKMPEAVRDLAIAVIHSDREGGRQLERAVDILARQVAQIDRAAFNRERVDNERRLAAVREETASLDRSIREHAELNLSSIAYRGEDLLPIDISAIVERERPVHGWFGDRLDLDARFEPRFGNAEVTEARTLRAELGADIAYATAQLPNAGMIQALPDTATLLAVHAALVRQAKSEQRRAKGDLPHLSLATSTAAEDVRAVYAWLEAFSDWLNQAAAGGDAWVLDAYQTLLDGRPTDRATKEALSSLCAEWARLHDDAQVFALRGIEVPASAYGDVAFDSAVEKLVHGSRPFGLFGQSALKARVAAVRIDGATPADTASWSLVRDWLQWQRQVQTFLGRWNAAARVLGLVQLPTEWEAGSAELLRLGSLIERLHCFHREVPSWTVILRALFPHGVDARRVLVMGEVAAVKEALAVNIDESGTEEVGAVREFLRAIAFDGPNLAFHSAIGRVCAALGDPATDLHKLAEEWSALVAEAVRLAALRPLRERLEVIGAAVAASGAPTWMACLLGKRTDQSEDRWTPPLWRETWEWARAAGFIERIADRAGLARILAKRAELEDEQRRLLAEIVRLRTFIGLKQNITERVASALAKFAVAVRKIGAGTGRSAERHRRASREAALEAADAVPCWILPEWRVAEQLPSALATFDLVVVDEASQSDITSLPVVLRGKKLLVVGDDKQVSPTAVGMEERTAIQLRETHLRGMPIASFLDPTTSLYDLASMTFPGSVTMLREHFRCVEPIVRFSGRFYPKALVPLRLPTASERLDPPLVDVYLPHGRKIRDVNEAEAAYIVEEAKKIVADPMMRDRSIGVISLIGDKQAKLIMTRLSEEIGAEALIRHKVMCGNATTFQGQERDIVLLSMVACPQTARAQTARPMEQRFNVAMSRARDRLYLVRSVTTSMLSPTDLKLAVIEHFRRPMGDAVVAQPTEILEACDSGFEREVGRRLVARGYRTRPQVRVGDFRIDFVVEGEGDRQLAIELDGDRFHGPDRWADDLRRQRALERLGWTFWRCWGSHWLADPESCMDDLVSTLARLGIEPITGDFSPQQFTRHITLDADAALVGEDQRGCGSTDRPPTLINSQPASMCSSDPVAERKEPTTQLPAAADIRNGIAADVNETVVSAGDTVIVRFADSGALRRFRICKDMHDPARGVVNAAQPLARALLDSGVDDEVTFEVDGRERVAVVERILKDAA